MRFSHIAWNLSGLTLPLGVAAFTVPHLIDKLGHERFGLLALAWGLIGYAGALDLGLGRALTQMVASFRGEKNLALIPTAVATAGRITLLSGIVAGILISLFALFGGAGLIRKQNTPEFEIQMAILLMAVALPAQAMSATYKGLNEAFMNFKGVNLLRAGLGVVNFAGPYLVSLFTMKLPWLVLTLIVSRLMALLIYKNLANACLRRQVGSLLQAGGYSVHVAKRLFAFGGWVTVSSIISPIMVQADRFIIAFKISAAAVSMYVLPYEVVVQSLVLVGAISSVMFPGLSKLMREDSDQWKKYFRKWRAIVALMMAVVCCALMASLSWLLSLWIGSRLDPQSVLIGKILCVGVFFNAIGSMHYSAIHAFGHAKSTAIIHLFELPIYLSSLIILVKNYSTIGAAIAWSSRMSIDAIALGIVYQRICRER